MKRLSTGSFFGKGCTYFSRWQFSINEGEFPNIHFNFRTGFLYIALREGMRWHGHVYGGPK